MAIVIGDIHGGVEKVQAFLNYRPEQEHVALGDYLDSFTEPQDRQIECLNLLLDSPTIMLWGNHDLNYLSTPPWTCSGYQWHTHEPLVTLIEANKNRFLAAYAVDGWLLTHAGCHIRVAKHMTDVFAISEMLNKKMAAYLERPTKFLLNTTTLPCPKMFHVSIVRGGDNRSGGIFWFDFKREDGLAPVPQIFGHTETKEPVVTDSYVALDTTNIKDKVFLFDTDTGKIVCLPMPEKGHIIIKNLPEQEREPFLKWLDGQTRPFVDDVPEDEQDFCYRSDYERWKRNPDSWED